MCAGIGRPRTSQSCQEQHCWETTLLGMWCPRTIWRSSAMNSKLLNRTLCSASKSKKPWRNCCWVHTGGDCMQARPNHETCGSTCDCPLLMCSEHHIADAGGSIKHEVYVTADHPARTYIKSPGHFGHS